MSPYSTVGFFSGWIILFRLLCINFTCMYQSWIISPKPDKHLLIFAGLLGSRILSAVELAQQLQQLISCIVDTWGTLASYWYICFWTKWAVLFLEYCFTCSNCLGLNGCLFVLSNIRWTSNVPALKFYKTNWLNKKCTYSKNVIVWHSGLVFTINIASIITTYGVKGNVNVNTRGLIMTC